jgi:hypothetical protein
MLDKQNLKQSLDKFGQDVIKAARQNLTRKNRNVTNALYQSLKFNSKVSKNSIQVDFLMADYGKFQDQGVKGAKSSARAPKSPFKFGSGSGKKGGLTKGVKRWVRKRGIKFVSNGRKLTFDATARLITRSIYNKGLKATEFFSRPFNAAYEKLPNDLAEAYGLDVESFIKLSLKNYGR